jgi:hypothetical protein
MRNQGDCLIFLQVRDKNRICQADLQVRSQEIGLRWHVTLDVTLQVTLLEKGSPASAPINTRIFRDM